jgi:hypothetical protein
MALTSVAPTFSYCLFHSFPSTLSRIPRMFFHAHSAYTSTNRRCPTRLLPHPHHPGALFVPAFSDLPVRRYRLLLLHTSCARPRLPLCRHLFHG